MDVVVGSGAEGVVPLHIMFVIHFPANGARHRVMDSKGKNAVSYEGLVAFDFWKRE